MYNLHSVTSNAVFNAFGKISAQQEATIVPSRFVTGYTAWCFWYRCGRIISVKIYTDRVLGHLNSFDAIFTGLPKPIQNITPMGIATWAGDIKGNYLISNNGEVYIQGSNSWTDVEISAYTSITYITIDD